MKHLGVDTLVLLMMENRSFDHMLGHLGLPQFSNGTKVDGLDPKKIASGAYGNPYQGMVYDPFAMKDGPLVSDLPHERDRIAQQTAQSKVSGTFGMNGFVDAYFGYTNGQFVTKHPDPMGYFEPDQVPITRFLADEYLVCDRWFAPLPASTHPNRFMSLCGTTRVDVTGGILPPVGKPMLLDWLTARNVRWRVYPKALSFFMLMGRLDLAFSTGFRPFANLANDVRNEPDATFPQVILVEPSYADAPHVGNDVPNDNHAPLAVAPGEAFIRDVYLALTSNPKRWGRTVFVVTYDEHGGFFDHVPPPMIPFARPADADAKFTTGFDSLGVRVPTIVASPLVARRSVSSTLFDHTSILQWVAEQFGSMGETYSQSVERRRVDGVASFGATLGSVARADVPVPPKAPASVGLTLAGPTAPPSPGAGAFEAAVRSAMTTRPGEMQARFPEVWKKFAQP